MMQRREGDAETLWTALLDLFTDYLTPAHLDQIYAGCTLASLTGHASRADQLAKQGYERALDAAVNEMARGQGTIDKTKLHAALTLATGSITTATACASPEAKVTVLNAAHTAVMALLTQARA